MRDPRPFVRKFKISAAVSISSCPVRNTKMSPGTACTGKGRSDLKWGMRWGEVEVEKEKKGEEGEGKGGKKG